MTQAETQHPEIGEATNGALRVARRKMIMSAALAKDAENRLDLQENGDKKNSGTIFHKVMGNVASGFQCAEQIETELDNRGVDYKPTEEVRQQV